MSAAKYTAVGLLASLVLWVGSRDILGNKSQNQDPLAPLVNPDVSNPDNAAKKKRQPLLPWRRPHEGDTTCCACGCESCCGDEGCKCAKIGTRCKPTCTCVKQGSYEDPSFVGAKVGGNTAPDGAPIQIDLPPDLQLKNVGGSDGAGLCVFTSITHAARWANLPVLQDFQQWMRKYPGGGWPEKVTKMIEKYCKEKNLPIPNYIQVEDSDLEILKLACRTGRMPCVTYGVSPTGRYGGQHIAHMVNIFHGSDGYFAVLDNNFPQRPGNENAIEWMTPQEFLRSYTSGGRSGWTVIFLDPGPPPCPHN